MSRSGRTRQKAKDAQRRPKDAPYDRARVAEAIGLEALSMAKWAHAAGLASIGHLLEHVALAAGSTAAAIRWPVDAEQASLAGPTVKAPRLR